MRRTLSLLVLGCHVEVLCQDAEVLALLEMNYASLQGSRGKAALRYTVGRRAAPPALFMAREGRIAWTADDPGEFLYRFEHELTVALQRLRRDLYFVHAAVLEVAGKAIMLVGASGCGKSTTAWAMLHDGCRYFSDELGPIDPTTLMVYPYPRALCLKTMPPEPYPLPEQTLNAAHTLHVPTAALPGGVATGPAPVAALFFVRYSQQAAAPALRYMGPAEGAAHLLAHALNPLAHPTDGLDGAIALTTRTACFALLTADLPLTCALLRTTLQGLGHG